MVWMTRLWPSLLALARVVCSMLRAGARSIISPLPGHCPKKAPSAWSRARLYIDEERLP
jgi:hypothetical protein